MKIMLYFACIVMLFIIVRLLFFSWHFDDDSLCDQTILILLFFLTYNHICEVQFNLFYFTILYIMRNHVT